MTFTSLNGKSKMEKTPRNPSKSVRQTSAFLPLAQPSAGAPRSPPQVQPLRGFDLLPFSLERCSVGRSVALRRGRHP